MKKAQPENIVEADVESDACDYARELGGVALKLVLSDERGFPDRTFLLPEGIIVFIELKRPRGGKTSPQQVAWIRRLEALGFIAGVARSMDEVKALVERFRQRRRDYRGFEE